jgi:hypothetical protein
MATKMAGSMGETTAVQRVDSMAPKWECWMAVKWVRSTAATLAVQMAHCWAEK